MELHLARQRQPHIWADASASTPLSDDSSSLRTVSAERQRRLPCRRRSPPTPASKKSWPGIRGGPAGSSGHMSDAIAAAVYNLSALRKLESACSQSGQQSFSLSAFDASHEAQGVFFEVTSDGHLLPCCQERDELALERVGGIGSLFCEGEEGDLMQGEASPEMNSKTIWASLGQRLNLSGVLFASRIVLSEQHLAIPHVSVPDIRWVDWSALRRHGFQGVVFDKDNTLTAPYKLSVWPALSKSLEECKSVFEGLVALLSNSAGLHQYDPDGSEANTLETALNIPVIRHDSKKPAGSAEEVAKFFGCEPSLLVMVGDRYFTDVVYGNRNGLLTIRPAPLTLQGEPFIVQQVRKLEESLVERWGRNGVTPASHKLFTSAQDFVKASVSC